MWGKKPGKKTKNTGSEYFFNRIQNLNQFMSGANYTLLSIINLGLEFSH